MRSSATASQCMVKGPADHPVHLCPLCVCVFAVCCWVTVKIKRVEVICWRCTRSWLDCKFQCKQVVFFKVADLTNASGMVWATLTIELTYWCEKRVDSPKPSLAEELPAVNVGYVFLRPPGHQIPSRYCTQTGMTSTVTLSHTRTHTHTYAHTHS